MFRRAQGVQDPNAQEQMMRLTWLSLMAALLIVQGASALFAQGSDNQRRRPAQQPTSASEAFAAFLQNRKGARAAEQPNLAVPLTHADVSYGDHNKQAFDLWLAESKDGKRTPLVIFIHGGGFRGGDKRNINNLPIQKYLDQGISFASLNYRLSDAGTYPIMMRDAARGLQYIRSSAKDWNIDPDRIACFGGSAGAGISLWLAFHDDLAEPESPDPVARQSTRIVAAGSINGQPTYDLRTFREWFGVPNLKQHPALYFFFGVEKEDDWESSRVQSLMSDSAAITHLTKDDPPVFMTYSRGDVPVDDNSPPDLWVHHARLGLKLDEAMEALGLECHVTWNDRPDQDFADIHDFLQQKVCAQSETKTPGK
ncbi:MAG: alpha/beta hydrolase [Planctomycetaceae bacterium]